MPNNETYNAIKQLESGEGKRFATLEQLMHDLEDKPSTLTKAQVEKEIERMEDTISKYRSFEEVTESRKQLEAMRELLVKMNAVDVDNG